MSRRRTLDVALRSGEIGMRSRLPLARLAGERLIAQVPGRDLRAHGGPSAHVEVHQRLRRGITGDAEIARDHRRRRSRRAEAGALQRQERDFLRRIEPAEVAIELQAVDHAGAGGGAAEKHVLRTQIAVSVDDSRPAAGECPRIPADEIELRLGEADDPRADEVQIARAELIGIAPDLPPKPLPISAVRQRPVLGTPKECRECRHEPVEVLRAQRARREHPIEHPPRSQPAHLHQPVDDLPLAERQRSLRVSGERHDAQVHLGREAPVEAHFVATHALPPGQRAIVHGSLAQRLLELVGARAREEHPGEVSLDDLDRARPSRIVARIREPLDLRAHPGVGAARAHGSGAAGRPPGRVAKGGGGQEEWLYRDSRDCVAAMHVLHSDYYGRAAGSYVCGGGEYYYPRDRRHGTLAGSRSRGGGMTEGTAMTIRRVTAPLLYAQSAPGRWLHGPRAALDEAAAVLCRANWRGTRPVELRPVRLESPSRRAR